MKDSRKMLPQPDKIVKNYEVITSKNLHRETTKQKCKESGKKYSEMTVKMKWELMEFRKETGRKKIH